MNVNIKLNIPFLNQKLDTANGQEVINFIKKHNPEIALEQMNCVTAHKLLWQAYEVNRAKDIENNFKRNDEISAFNKRLTI